MLPIRASLIPGALTLLLLAGCSRPIAPQASNAGDREAAAAASSAGRLFYPLDLGNHWSFHRVFTLRAADSGSPFAEVVRRSSIAHDLICVDTIGDRNYVVDRITQIDSTLAGPVTFHQWIRNRQDPTGLYEADVDIGSVPECETPAASSPPAGDLELLDGWRTSAVMIDGGALARAKAQVASRLSIIRQLLMGGPGGPEEGELTRLRYPMTVGSSWVVREEPLRFVSKVEAQETLRFPFGNISALRVHTAGPGLGANDRVLTWYSRSGMVGIFVHIEIPTDLGLLIAEDVIDLEALSIDRGRF